MFSLDASELDEAPLWVAWFSLYWSPVLLEVSTTVPSPGSVVVLVGLEGGLVGSCPYGLELDLTSSANLGMFSSPFIELCSLLTSTSWESTWVSLLHWSLSALLEEWSCFFCVGLPMNLADGHPTGGVPRKRIPSRRGTGRGGVPGQWAGLSEGARACEPSGSGAVVVTGMSSLCCTAIVSTLFVWQRGTAEKMHQGSSLTESVEFVWEKTSWKVVSVSSVIWASCFSCFLANLIWQSSYFLVNSSTSLANSHSSWTLAQLMPCNCIRAGWNRGPSSIWKPSSVWGWRDNKGTNSSIGLDRQCSSLELFHKVFWKKG